MRKYYLHRCDRDGKLVERRFTRRQQLQLEARPDQRTNDLVGAMTSGKLNDLERDTGDQWDTDDAADDQSPPRQQPER